MTAPTRDPVEIYQMQKAKDRQRTEPYRTPGRDRNQFTLTGERIEAGTIRQRREALKEGRFLP